MSRIHAPGKPGAVLQGVSNPMAARFACSRCEGCLGPIVPDEIIVAVKYQSQMNVYYHEIHLPKNLRRWRYRFWQQKKVRVPRRASSSY